MKNFKSLIFLLISLLSSSCKDDNKDIKSELLLIQKETQLVIPFNVVRIGETIETIDFDEIKTNVYKIPIGKRVDFVEKINEYGDSLNEYGYWRKAGEYLIYKSNPKKRSIYIEMEYSMLSNILIVNWYNI